MTVQQVAAALEISPSRVRHDVLDGRLAASKEGRDLFIADEEFVRYKATRPKRGRPRGSKDRQPRTHRPAEEQGGKP